jgi:hypothetical protein
VSVKSYASSCAGQDDGANNCNTWWKMREVCMLVDIADIKAHSILEQNIRKREIIGLFSCLYKFFSFKEATPFAIFSSCGTCDRSKNSRKRSVTHITYRVDAFSS